jgi:hypothetical protein
MSTVIRRYSSESIDAAMVNPTVEIAVDFDSREQSGEITVVQIDETSLRGVHRV